MTKKELITEVEYIIEGIDFGENIFKAVKDISILIQKEKIKQ